MSAITATCEGNLVADPELRETSTGLAVCNFRLAVTNRVRAGNNDFVDQTEWINVVAWRNTAVNVNASLKKGDRVIVSGSLKLREWTHRDGHKMITPEIHASSVGAALTFHVMRPEKARDALASFADSPQDDPIYDEATA
jgi:single-strand DNA-binding protein